MEKKYTEGLNNDQAVRLAVQTLLEVVEGSEHLDVCLMHSNGKIEMVEDEKVTAIHTELKAEKEAAEAAKKKKAD